MKKTLWIAILCGIMAALFTGICGVMADAPVFWFYENNDYDEHMKPLDLTPVRFYVQENKEEGTYDLQLTIRNVSDRAWPAGAYDLLCKKGSDMLAEGEGPRWTIDQDVPRGTRIVMHTTLKEFTPGKRMTFFIMDGNNSFNGFYIQL